MQSEEEARRQRLANLFYAMDTDLNGVLDVEEFREAMRQVGGWNSKKRVLRTSLGPQRRAGRGGVPGGHVPGGGVGVT